MKNILFFQLTLIVMFYLSVSVCQENPSDKEKLIELAWHQFNEAITIVERAKSIEDFKQAITVFEEAKRNSIYAGLYTELGRSINYNLGLLYDKTENYDEASFFLSMYISSTPPPDDSAEVRKMIDQIVNKAQQFINPATLTGIWYYSVPRESSEPRLEIRVNNGVLEARCLTSEAAQGWIPNGDFIPVKWDPIDKTLVVFEASYFTCDQSVDPNWCPQKVMLNLVRTGEHKLEGELSRTGIIYQDLDNPEIFTSSGKVVFERYQK